MSEFENKDVSDTKVKILIYSCAITACCILVVGIIYLIGAFNTPKAAQIVELPASTDIYVYVDVTESPTVPQTTVIPTHINTIPDIKVKESEGTIMTLGSEKKLIELLKEQQSNYGIVSASYSLASADASKSVTDSFSTTNIQVEGVDEGDIVKTDGKYIYAIRNEKKTNTNVLSIAEVLQGGQLKIVNEMHLQEGPKGYISIRDLYLNENTVTIIGGSTGNSYTLVSVYGVDDPTAPLKLQKYFEIEGYYKSSRRIGSTIYVVTIKNIYYNEKDTSKIQPPLIRNNPDGQFDNISYDNIKYFPDVDYKGYLCISSIDTSKSDQNTQVAAFLCTGEIIYSSINNLYITNYCYIDNQGSTQICKFAYENGTVAYKAKSQKIPGNVLNQYSMDEYNGIFRIALTNWDRISRTNSVYLFDADMKNPSSLTGIAPGESIFSVRFMGKMGYVVTSVRYDDPLFVLDLSNPGAPKILGELQIPGFSQYLHPYDETHMIGVGQGGSSNDDRTFKMSMFDVSDPANPKEMFSTNLCDNLHFISSSFDPKSFLLDQNRGCIALPGTSRGTGTGTVPFVDIYSVDLVNGFTLKSQININIIDWLNSNGIVRELYINNMFYIVTNNNINVYNYETLEPVQTLKYE